MPSLVCMRVLPLCERSQVQLPFWVDIFFILTLCEGLMFWYIAFSNKVLLRSTFSPGLLRTSRYVKCLYCPHDVGGPRFKSPVFFFFFLTVAGGVVSSVRAMDLGYGAPVYLRDFRPQLPGFPLTCEVRGSSLSVVRCLCVPHQSFVYVKLA